MEARFDWPKRLPLQQRRLAGWDNQQKSPTLFLRQQYICGSVLLEYAYPIRTAFHP